MAQEKQFENKVKNFLKERGFYFVKFFANNYTKKGVPDILACVGGYFVGIEVKSEKGHPSELQIYNIEQIRKVGGFAFVLYPSGYDDFVKFINGLRDGYFEDVDTMPLVMK